MKSWYTFKNKAAGVLDISIHEEIGAYGVSASAFMAALKAEDDVKVINLSVHSPGGEIFDGLAIYNTLKAHPAKVMATVPGLAASAASVILMAADEITMPENAFLMIHNPWTIAMGDAAELRAVADVAESIQTSMVGIYTKRTGMDEEEVRAMMAEETWIGAEQAMDLGMIDNISDSIDLAAKVVGFEKHFKTLPVEASGDIILIESIDGITELEAFLREAGEFSRQAAKALVARSKALFEREALNTAESETAILEALNRISVPGSLGNAEQ